jgi:hypothetical protein
VRLDDPNLRRFPYLYAVEVGRMGSDPSAGLRNYCCRRVLFVDDFWGLYEWGTSREHPARPARVQDRDMSSSIPVSPYYDIKKFLQVPVVSNGCSGPYWESATTRSHASAASSMRKAGCWC